MNRFKKALLLVPLLALTILPGITSAASESDDELAKQALSNYIDAVKKEDVHEAMNWVIDKRFDSTQEQLDAYSGALKDNPFSDVTITDISPVPDGTFTADVELTRKDTGEVNNVSYQLIKSNETWKVIIDGQETASNRVIQKTIQLEPSDAIIPLAATLLASYGDSPVSVDDSIYSNEFDMTEASIGITGWQENPGSIGQADVRYALVKKGIFSDEMLGSVVILKYTAWNGAAFYTTIDVGYAYSDVHLKVTNVDDNQIRVRGHVYGN
jgi:hypothetical protein